MANIIEIIEQNNRLDFASTYSPIVCGNSNYYLRFIFSDAWKKANKKAAIFVVDAQKQVVDFDGDECRVPILPNGAFVFVSLVSGDGENQLVTTPIRIRLETNSYCADLSEFNQTASYLSKVLGAINKIENGSVSVENAKVAETAKNVINSNLLINGDLKINQRGKETYSGSNIYCVDRWMITTQTSSYNTITKHFKTTTQYGSIRQNIENYTDFAGKTLTLSCKISHVVSDADDLYLAFMDGVNTNKVKITEPGILSVTATLTENPTRLSCMIYKTGTSGQACEVVVDYMKLEVGETPTTFVPRLYAEELALCQRYYYTTTGSNSTGLCGLAVNAFNTKIYQMLWEFPVTMRTDPTITKNGEFNIQVKGVVDTILAITSQLCSGDKIALRFNVENGTEIGNTGSIQKNYDATAQITFDAEIY